MQIRDLATGRMFDSLKNAKNHPSFSGRYYHEKKNKREIIYQFPTMDMFATIGAAAIAAGVSINKMSDAIKNGHDINGFTYGRGPTPRYAPPVADVPYLTIRHDGTRWVFNSVTHANSYQDFRRILRQLSPVRRDTSEVIDLMEESKHGIVTISKDLFGCLA